jgi:bacillolysin
VVNIAKANTYAAQAKVLVAKGSFMVQSDRDQLRQALTYLNALDIFVNTIMFVKFLREEVTLPNVTQGNVLIGVHNVQRLDNAFFTGAYMVYGNGDKMFWPMGCIDVTGHEHGHGVVECLVPGGLIYSGHSGALNEHYADDVGVEFEWWVYDHLPGVAGVPDWEMGEDVVMPGQKRYLRDYARPESGLNPQPSKYRGQYWADPNSQQDFGGVHTNSGVGNNISYKIAGGSTSTQASRRAAFQQSMNSLRKLNPRSSYLEFRDALLSSAPPDLLARTKTCLNEAMLGDSAVSDWQKK